MENDENFGVEINKQLPRGRKRTRRKSSDIAADAEAVSGGVLDTKSPTSNIDTDWPFNHHM